MVDLGWGYERNFYNVNDPGIELGLVRDRTRGRGRGRWGSKRV